MGGGNKGMIVSCTHTKSESILRGAFLYAIMSTFRDAEAPKIVVASRRGQPGALPPKTPEESVTQTVHIQRAHTHSELIREWLWEPKGSSLVWCLNVIMSKFRGAAAPENVVASRRGQPGALPPKIPVESIQHGHVYPTC